MKAYIFEDSLFCYVAVVVANSKEEALKFYNKHEAYAFKEADGKTITEKPIKEGFLVEGGGNG